MLYKLFNKLKFYYIYIFLRNLNIEYLRGGHEHGSSGKGIARDHGARYDAELRGVLSRWKLFSLGGVIGWAGYSAHSRLLVRRSGGVLRSNRLRNSPHGTPSIYRIRRLSEESAEDVQLALITTLIVWPHMYCCK